MAEIIKATDVAMIHQVAKVLKARPEPVALSNGARTRVLDTVEESMIKATTDIERMARIVKVLEAKPQPIFLTDEERSSILKMVSEICKNPEAHRGLFIRIGISEVQCTACRRASRR